ncbi:hypothetical protein HG549_25710 [Pseudomonas sp. SK]|uniref:hypothetical protein n=1 Tax=Pseudomonas sp. SK TaxID=2729423 RepID=UPI0014639C6C|nr:hypothetical protein [Pseudomonas sp. SK]QJQ23192.1 hypothetical protein HG549_25710 [Pseudomonas sp. SK]
MKREILLFCLLVTGVGIATVLYLMGLSGKSLAMAALFLLCPVFVGVQLLRGVRQFDKDMSEARRIMQKKNLP